eukprot:g15675.t1
MGSGSSSGKATAFSQDLRGKHFVVTGANTGLGYATTRELAKMGAKVTLACRNPDRGQQAVDKIKEEALEKPVKEGVDLLEGLTGVDVQVEVLDLGSLQSVIAFAQRFKTSGAKVDVLINNAGIMALPERRETVDGFEMQIGVNHFGGHLLTRLMEPMIVDGGRVVFLSSIGHDRPPGMPKITLDWDNINYEKPDTYNNWMAYGRSKLANVLDAKEFAKRLGERGINTYAVHPGVVNTELTRNMTDNSFVSRLSRWLAPVMKYMLVSPLTGALTQLRCAVDPALGAKELSGKYWADMKEAQPSKLASDPANPPRFWESGSNLHALWTFCAGAETSDGKKFKHSTLASGDIVGRTCSASDIATDGIDIKHSCTVDIEEGDYVVKDWHDPPLHPYCAKRLWRAEVDKNLVNKLEYKDIGTIAEKESAQLSAPVPDDLDI